MGGEMLFSDKECRRRSSPSCASWCRKNAGPTSGAQRCPVITSASETTRLGIHECAAGPSGPAGGLIVERNLRLCGCRSVWDLRNNYDAGVPPASFLVYGSQGPPCDPKLTSTITHPRLRSPHA